MILYEVTLWPNNQEPLLLGYYKAGSPAVAKKKAAKDCSLCADDDNLSAIPKSKDTPYERWQRS